MRDWCTAKALPGPPAVRAMRLLAARLVAPPPHDLVMNAGRVVPCKEALAPHLATLAEQAETAGWHSEEVASAITAWAADYAH